MYKVRIQINQSNTQISNYFDLVSNKTKNVRGVGKNERLHHIRTTGNWYCLKDCCILFAYLYCV